MSNIIVAKPWDVPEGLNPVINTGQQYLKFINSAVFSEEARHFMKYGYYTDAPIDSKDYNDYWDEQEKRCLEGYSVGGVRITGRHYFFLNFGQMLAIPIDPNTGKPSKTRKILTFPRFLDHQYYLSHEFEKNFGEGQYEGNARKGMVIFKARRKGITYVNCDEVLAYDFTFIPNSKCVIAAYEKGHYTVTLDGVHYALNHINKHTAWAKRRDWINTRDHFRASFKYRDNTGVELEDGYMSEVECISFKDNPFKGIGYSVDKFCWEEAGRFNNLMAAYKFSEPTWREGEIMTGIPIIWGTGGDTGGASADLEELFYNPSSYGLASYDNIYDENATGECGYFIDELWFRSGSIRKHIVGLDGVKKEAILDLVDVEGNSYRQLAEEALDNEREKIRKGSRDAYNKAITQAPKTPAEGFLKIDGNVFDSVRAAARLSEIQINPRKYINTIYMADLQIIAATNEVIYVPDTKSIPMRNYPFPYKNNKDKPGAIEIYEMPIKGEGGGINYGRYIGGIDSFDKDVSSTDSFGSLLILDLWTERIVCHYKGRPMSHVFYENCRKIVKFYNAVANYERSNINIYTHFYNHNSLHLLADEPECLAERGLASKEKIGNNKKGTPCNEQTKTLGIELALTWLSRHANGYDDNPEMSNYDLIRSTELLKELMHWNPKGNFDDISALGQLMIYREDKVKTIKKLVDKVKTIKDDPWFGDKFIGKKNKTSFML